MAACQGISFQPGPTTRVGGGQSQERSGQGAAPAAGEVRGVPPAPGLQRAATMQGVVHLSLNPWNESLTYLAL